MIYIYIYVYKTLSPWSRFYAAIERPCLYNLCSVPKNMFKFLYFSRFAFNPHLPPRPVFAKWQRSLRFFDKSSTTHSFHIFLVFLIILDFSLLIMWGENYQSWSVSVCHSNRSCAISKFRIFNTVPCTHTHSKTHIILRIDTYTCVRKWVRLLDGVVLFSKWLSQIHVVIRRNNSSGFEN